jgi:hypothetical protein
MDIKWHLYSLQRDTLQPLYYKTHDCFWKLETGRLLPAIEATFQELVSKKRQLYYYSLNLKLKSTNFIPDSVSLLFSVIVHSTAVSNITVLD